MRLNINVLILFCLSFSPLSFAQDYSPQGFYDVTYYQLENGMGVVLKKRGESQSVSVRLGINVGFNDFPCDKRETPHFLEHLLFTGTNKFSEYELEKFIDERGGGSNATTDHFRTMYEVDIYNQYLTDALSYLHNIITDTLITPENIEITRDIINQENGGVSSALSKWLFLRGIGKNGAEKVLGRLGIICNNIVTPDEVTRDDIMEAYRDYYAPNNMVISVVGDFSEADALAVIRKLFGRLPQKPIPVRAPFLLSTSLGPMDESSTLAPFVDNTASVGISVLLPGMWSDELYAFRLMESYLHDRIYNRIRIEKGLAYDPSAYLTELDDYSLLEVSADIDPGNMEQVLSILMEEIESLRNGDVDPAEFQHVKKSLLLGYVQGYESNSDYADYYVIHERELREQGMFRNEESLIADVTHHEFIELAKRYLVETNIFTYRNSPTLTEHQLYATIAVFSVFVVLISVFYLYRLKQGYRDRCDG